MPAIFSANGFACLLSLVSILLMLWLTTKIVSIRSSRWALVVSWAVLLSGIVVGFYGVRFAADGTKRSRQQRLSSLALAMALTVQEMGHADLTSNTPPDDPLYQKILARLNLWTDRLPDVASIYTIREDKDGRFVYMVDADSDLNKNGRIDPGDEETFPLGTVYDEEPEDVPEFVDAFRGRSGFNNVPFEDELGIWITAAEPMYDEQGHVEAILGVDFWGKDWIREVAAAEFWPTLFFFTFLLLFFFVQLFLVQRYFTDQKLKEYAASLEATVEQLTEAKRETEAAVQAKGFFLANMSHEIRTPMNAILGCSEMLAAQISGEEISLSQGEMIDIIRKSSSDLMTIIDDILTFSKLDSNRVVLESIPIVLRELVDDVKGMLKPRLDENPALEFRVQWNEPLPHTILGDPTRLRQILINLLSNAIKFTEKGFVMVRCNLLETPPAPPGVADASSVIEPGHTSLFSIFASKIRGSSAVLKSGVAMPPVRSAEFTPVPGRSYIRFEIVDTGIGLTPEQIGRLFKPFSQADVTSTRKYGGTGLGLGIARGLARLMNGDISIRSVVRQGSTFTVLIPARTPDEADLHMPTLAETEIKPPIPIKPGAAVRYEDLPLEGLRVLVVDDGVVNQMVAESKLRDAGAVVDIASNGRMAIEKVAAAQAGEKPYDAILMDMQMPVMDGFEATRELRRSEYRRPILAVSATFDEDDEARRAGCDISLTKPLDRQELIDAILQLSQIYYDEQAKH